MDCSFDKFEDGMKLYLNLIKMYSKINALDSLNELDSLIEFDYLNE